MKANQNSPLLHEPSYTLRLFAMVPREKTITDRRYSCTLQPDTPGAA